MRKTYLVCSVQQHILYLDLQADGIQGHWMSPQAQLLLGRQNPSPEDLHTLRMDRGSQMKQKVDWVKRQRTGGGGGRSINTLIESTTLHVCI